MTTGILKEFSSRGGRGFQDNLLSATR